MEDEVSYLAKLNAVQLKKPQGLTPAEQRRAKLVAKLEEQLRFGSLEQTAADLRRRIETLERAPEFTGCLLWPPRDKIRPGKEELVRQRLGTQI